MLEKLSPRRLKEGMLQRTRDEMEELLLAGAGAFTRDFDPVTCRYLTLIQGVPPRVLVRVWGGVNLSCLSILDVKRVDVILHAVDASFS